MRLVSGMDVLWRGAGSSQVGTDPRCAVVLDGLTGAEQRLLEALDRAPTRADLHRYGATAGLTKSQVDHLVELLTRAGVLTHQASEIIGHGSGRRPAGDGATGDAQWRDRAGLAGLPAADTVRERTVVGVTGLGRTGALTATGLAAAGVGTLLVSDPAPVLSTDVLPYRAPDVGRTRESCVVDDLRAAVPALRIGAAPGTRPDLVVVTTPRVSDPPLLRRLAQEDVAHLVVVVGELATTVGPLVVPGRGPCMRCLDVARAAAERAWPAVATQLRVLPEPAESYAQASWAAATAVGAATAYLDAPGTPHALTGASLELDLDGEEIRREWAVHPECGCTAPVPG
ncbi:hypothetical protein [Georgenia sp. Z1491]|uniref:hypothetical protein n=1 Tax=Georgenia sp. Z1491 TaxID=3416707 RepID=UPI003CFA0076